MDIEQLYERFLEISKKYNLSSEENASKIADFLTKDIINNIHAKEFSGEFKMELNDAKDFLTYLKKGLEFKEKHLKTNSENNI